VSMMFMMVPPWLGPRGLMTATLLAIAGGHRSLADRTAECGQRITCNGTVFARTTAPSSSGWRRVRFPRRTGDP
jgi:hypothetical protein